MLETFYCATHRVRVTITRDEETGHTHRDIRGPIGFCTLKEGLPLDGLRKVAGGESVQHDPGRGQKTYPGVALVSVDQSGTPTFAREVIREEAGE